ncbi:MAG: hypothetical protein J6T88_03480 [Bacteroidales bacterium]|nr:hypothetical protein [Bacteroidales bacterium]
MKQNYRLLLVTLLVLAPMCAAAQTNTLMSCDFSDPSQYSTGIIGENEYVNGQPIPQHQQYRYHSSWRLMPNTIAYNDVDYPVLTYYYNINGNMQSYSQTSNNGYMLMSMIDQCASMGGTGEWGNFDAYIAFPGFSTTNVSRPVLQLYQIYKKFVNDNCWLDYSTDSVYWECIEINTAMLNRSIYGKNIIVLPSVLANQQNVYIRIRWSSTDNYPGGAYGYYWSIDDVSVIPFPYDDVCNINFICPNECPIEISYNGSDIDCGVPDTVWRNTFCEYQMRYDDLHYTIDSVFVDNVPVDYTYYSHSLENTIGYVNFSINITSNHTVRFSFTQKPTPAVLSVLFEGNGRVEVSDYLYETYDSCQKYYVDYGEIVELTATPHDVSSFLRWSDGVTDNPRVVTINSDTTFCAIFVSGLDISICMVTVQDNHNMVIWEKGDTVRNYLIFRESSTPGEYDLIGTVPYDSVSTFIDYDSKPKTRSYRYVMTAEDINGYIHYYGWVHKTMHLSINKGMGNSWNLSWNEYEGAEFSTYLIFRGTSDGNLEQIDEMAVGGNNTYTDEDAPEEVVYYQVCVLKNTPCNPSKGEALIRSNVATNNPAAINGVTDKPAVVYSKNGQIFVDGAYGERVVITDVSGRVHYSTANNASPYNVPNSGVYFVKIGNHPARKVVVIR